MVPLSPKAMTFTQMSFRVIGGWTITRSDHLSLPGGAPHLLFDDGISALSIVTDDQSTDAPTYIVRFHDYADFALDYQTRTIDVVALNSAVTPNTIDHLLVDQIWPRIIAHRGELAIHASGVATDEGALLFVGESGRGKSTLAASLHQRGFALLGDDAMVISDQDGAALCRAVYPSLRLFPDSIATLFGDAVEQSEVASYTDKRNIFLDRADTAAAIPVRALFFLEPEGAARPTVTPLRPADACMRLVEHSFWLDPTDLALTAKKLASASALANAVPGFTIDYPRDFAALGDLHAALFAALPPLPPTGN